MTTWHVGVLIPARNEETLLQRCLESVLKAESAIKRAATLDVVVVSDGSTDRTVEIARTMLAGRGTVLRVKAGCVGTARAIAARLLLARFSGSVTRCWLANTDADCIVPVHWLSGQLMLASQGVEAVAGTVSVDSFEEHGPEVKGRFARTYAISLDGSHQHVHGANLGVRADAYLRCGGWQDLATAEDHDLWKRLRVGNAVTRSTNSIEVVTSGRRQGRAPHGFADALAAHNELAR